MPHKKIDLPLQERLGLSVNEAIALSGLGRSTVNALIRTGKLESAKVGDRRIVKPASLRKLLEEGLERKKAEDK